MNIIFKIFIKYDVICVGTEWTHVNMLIPSMKSTVLQMHDIMEKKKKNQFLKVRSIYIIPANDQLQLLSDSSWRISMEWLSIQKEHINELFWFSILLNSKEHCSPKLIEKGPILIAGKMEGEGSNLVVWQQNCIQIKWQSHLW